MQNKEVIKAMKRKPKQLKQQSQISKYVEKHLKEYETKKWNALEWSEERADKILQYYVPRVSKWYAEDNILEFGDNGTGWNYVYRLRKVKRKDCKWWRKFTSAWGGQVRTYLIEKFELEGFTKKVIDTEDGWTQIEFKLKEEPK